jgi:CheY-like chemotaxis protein
MKLETTRRGEIWEHQALKKKILIIDDEPDVLTYLRTFLRDQGYAVICAQDVESGLRMIPLENPDLICLDIMMPVKSGISLFDYVRKDDYLRNIPVIIISGLNEDSMENLFGTMKDSGMPITPYRFVGKPVDLNQLLSMVREILGEI